MRTPARMGLFSKKSSSEKASGHTSSKSIGLRTRFRLRLTPVIGNKDAAQNFSKGDSALASPSSTNKEFKSSAKKPFDFIEHIGFEPPPHCRFVLTPQKLGSGAYGSVLAGIDLEQPLASEPVAVKLIPDGRMKSTSLEREIDILRRLSDAGHPTHLKFIAHCPPEAVRAGEVLASTATGGKALSLPKLSNRTVALSACHALVMEAARGGEVFDHVIRIEGFLEVESGPVFAQLVDSVRAAHEIGIVHRDLKLENVLLVGRKGEVGHDRIKLIDWGLAHQHMIARDGTVLPELLRSRCGSRSYMAPEVTNREICGKVGYNGFAADVWSLGVCLFAMHLGFFPFEHANPDLDWRARRVIEAQQAGRSTMRTILSFYPPNRQSSRMSESLLALLDRMLVFDPKQRASIYEVLSSGWLAPHVAACRAPGGCLDRVSLLASRPCLNMTSEDSAAQSSCESDLGFNGGYVSPRLNESRYSFSHGPRGQLWVETERGWQLAELDSTSMALIAGAASGAPVDAHGDVTPLEREYGEGDSDGRSEAARSEAARSEASSAARLSDAGSTGGASLSSVARSASSATSASTSASTASSAFTSLTANPIHDADAAPPTARRHNSRRGVSAPPPYMPPGYAAVDHRDDTGPAPGLNPFMFESASRHQHASPSHSPTPTPETRPRRQRRNSLRGHETYPNFVVAGAKERPLPDSAQQQQQQEAHLAALLSKVCKVSRTGSPRRPDRQARSRSQSATVPSSPSAAVVTTVQVERV